MKLNLKTYFYQVGKIIAVTLSLTFLNNSYSSATNMDRCKVFQSTDIFCNNYNHNYSIVLNEQLRVAKSFAKTSFKRYLQRKGMVKTREVVIEIKEWSFDMQKERFSIEYEVTFEVMKDDFYLEDWIILKKTFLLSCDVDGRNAILTNEVEKVNFIFENINATQ